MHSVARRRARGGGLTFLRGLPKRIAMHSLALALALTLAAPKPAAPTKQDKIRALLALTHAEQAGVAMLEQAKKQLPREQYERLAQVLHPQDIVERIVPVYDRHFTERDIDGMITFWRSPVGQKLLKEGPAVTQESVAAGQQFAQEIFKKLAAEQKPADVPGK